MLFNIALDFVMRRTTTAVQGGIQWFGGRLVDLDFADDVAVLAEDSVALQRTTECLGDEASKIGLRLSSEKSKVMHVGNGTFGGDVYVGTGRLDVVNTFAYLGSTITTDGDVTVEVRSRIAKATAVFQRLRPLWTSSSISIDVKLRLYSSIVVPTAIYASETWKMSTSNVRRLNAFHCKCLRRIMKIRYADRITNVELLRRCRSKDLAEIVAERRLRFAGHILRMSMCRLPRLAMEWIPPNGKRPRGRPRNTWRRTFLNDLKMMNIPKQECEEVAQDRQRWREFVALCAQRHGRN
ncbi:hypothetical protein Q1695_015705 [Nippostrongylus brasiliensis]|nr:hypothetical protein Q1695_015705 [Nippostrongylus brasiliensis]